MSQSAVGAPGFVRRHRAAADPGSAACALGFASIVLLGFSDGGYYASTWRWAALALGAVVGIQLLLRRSALPRPLALVSLGALGALATWMLLSSLWGVEGTEALRETERCAVYIVGLGALIMVVTPSTSRVLLTGVLIGVVALAAFALGNHILSPQTLDPYQGSLLKEPVGYANALGVLMALGVVLSMGLVWGTRGRLARSALLGAATVSAVALMLTSSRGAWVAMLVGLGVLAACHVGWARHRRLLVGCIAAVAFAVVLPAVPRVSLGDRPAYWSVALADASDNALLGSGAGSFDDVWLEHRPIPAYVRDAHSLYLETAAELGVVGLALLLAALGTPLVAAVLARDQRHVATAAAGYAAFLVHAGLDWDWEMPVTMLAGLACAAVLLATTRDLSRS